MLAGGGANVTVQIGKHGVLLVDAPSQSFAAATLAAIAALTPAPIRYVVNTSATREHIAGNEAIAAQGRAGAKGTSGPNSANSAVSLGTAQGMTILAHEN